jgi:putative transposase
MATQRVSDKVDRLWSGGAVEPSVPPGEAGMPRKPCPRDLTDAQWAILGPLLPPAKPGGRPREGAMREVLNGLLSSLRTGAGWRPLPHDFPPHQTVYEDYTARRQDGRWAALHTTLRGRVRQRDGRERTPSAAISDRQSVETTAGGGVKGYDAGKQVEGRRRQLAVDPLGLMLAVAVHSAALQERTGAQLLPAALAAGGCPRLRLVWADGGYRGKLVARVQARCGWLLTIVQRTDAVTGGQVVPRRWVVARTVAWLGRSRRLSKDDASLPASSEAMTCVAMIQLLLVRLARPCLFRHALRWA